MLRPGSLTLPVSHEAAWRSGAFLWEVLDDDAANAHLDRRCSELARAADRCALDLRKTYRLPKRDVSDGIRCRDWDPTEPRRVRGNGVVKAVAEPHSSSDSS